MPPNPFSLLVNFLWKDAAYDPEVCWNFSVDVW